MRNFTSCLHCIEEELKTKQNPKNNEWHPQLQPTGFTFSWYSLTLLFWLPHEDKLQHKLMDFQMLDYSTASFYFVSATLLLSLFLSNLDPPYEHIQYPNTADKKKN